jgi:hypothetical protein
MLMGKLGGRATTTRPLAIAFVRLTARALADYNRAKSNATPRWWRPDFLWRRIEAVSDLESCFLTLHRAILYLDALRRRGLTTASGDIVGLRAKDFPGLDDARKRVRAMRNAILHTDDYIKSGEFTAGRAIAPWPHEGVITLEDTAVRLVELAEWLNQVAGIAKHIFILGASDVLSAA